jgi:hypothetical protein
MVIDGICVDDEVVGQASDALETNTSSTGLLPADVISTALA